MTSPTVLLDEAAVIRLKKAVNTDSDLVVWVGDWLTHLNVFSDAQIYEILKFVKESILGYERDKIHKRGSGKVTLAVSDSRWVSVHGHDCFFDTQVAEIITQLPYPAVTHIMCDVVALSAKMTKRQGHLDGKSNSSPFASQFREASRRQQQPQSGASEDDLSDDATD